MTIHCEKLGGHMAASVNGLDFNCLLTSETHAALLAALHENLVLCIRGQHLSPIAFRDAMAQFGAPMQRLALAHTPECAEVNILSSEDRQEIRGRCRLALRRYIHA